jgi:PST family polysaccharide transporter
MFKHLINKIGKELLGNSMWLLFDKVFRLMLGLFISVIVARYLGAEKVGIWNYVLAIFAFFSFFPSLGLEYIAPREFVKGDRKAGEMISTIWILKLLGGSLGVLIALIMMAIIKGPSDPIIFLIFIVLSGFLFQSFDVIDYFFQSKLSQKRSVIARMVAFAIVATYKGILVYLQADLVWFVASSTFEFLIAAIGLLIAFGIWEKKPQLHKVNWKLAKSLLKDSLPFSASAILILIYYRIDQIMVTEILGEKENGIYSITVKFFEYFMVLPYVLVSSFYPVISSAFQKDEKKFKAGLKQMYSLLSYLSFAAILGLWFLGPWLMSFLYGEEFQGSGEALQIISLALYPVFLGIASGNYLIIRNKKAFTFFKSVVGLGINVGLNFILIPKMGIVGAAWASVASNFVSTFMILFLKDNHNHLNLFLSPFNLSSIRRFFKYD